MSTSTLNSFYVRSLRRERRATRNRNMLAWLVMGLGIGLAAAGMLFR
ncbi:MAG TPA: hypothetical protein VJ781_13175 [Pyrinomonadaceae bacterium]|nr:hypothetical protein [Pyrinomonadaceae bacterium]